MSLLHKLFIRLIRKGERSLSLQAHRFIPIQVGFENRKLLLEKYPDEFTVPPHFTNYPYIAMWVPQTRVALLKEVVELAWRQIVSKKQISEGEKTQR